MKIPKRLQSVLWSADVKKLDLERDKQYIIHQILMRGSFEDLRWLFTVYPKEQVRRIFYHRSAKMYPKKVYFFIKNFVLGLADKKLDEQDYVTSISGSVRQRAAGRIS